MKLILKTFILTLVLSSAMYAEKTVSMVDAVNQQKVLLQQILKEYSFLGMGNNFKNSKGKLKTHLKDYSENFKILKKNLKDKKTSFALATSTKIWSSIEKDFQMKPSKEKVLDLQNKSDKILQELSILMKVVLNKDKKTSQDIISIAGYQAVIIERMAALYMIKTWGITDPKFAFKMRESITFFNNSLYKMLESPKTTVGNKLSIKKVMRTFKFFEMMNRSKSKFIPTLIYSKTTQIHKQITKITQTYIKEGK
jgi:hypothetical protein